VQLRDGHIVDDRTVRVIGQPIAGQLPARAGQEHEHAE
jgi:hypothetical protein